MGIRITNTKQPEGGGMVFRSIIEFEIIISDVSGDDVHYENELNKICEWVSNHFANNFVILEFSDHTIAGGCGSRSANRQLWIEQGSKVNRSDYACLSYYELRCFEDDATLFLLKWGK